MRIYQIIRGLAAQHHVTCLTFAPDARAEAALAPLRALCRVQCVLGPPARSMAQRAWTTLTSPLPDMALRNADPAYAAALAALLRQESFDIVQAESIEMAGYLQGIPAIIDQRSATPHRILDQFNAEYLFQQRAFLTDMRQPRRWHAALYSLVQWRKLARYEGQVMENCDAVIAVSDHDRRMLHRLTPNAQIVVATNGVDSTLFSRKILQHTGPGALSFRTPTLVFSGLLDFRPNIDALRWFIRDVFPLIRAHCSQLRLLIIGKRPVSELQALAQDQSIILVGEVPDTRPYIAGASVYVVPMRIGGGVRLKLLEALALEAPVVSTSMGAEGVDDLCNETHCLLADTQDQFAQAILRLLDDRRRGQELGTAGRALVQRRYDWRVILPRIESLYAALGNQIATPPSKR